MARRPSLKLVPLAAAACAAMAAWCSMGTLAVVNDRADDAVRVGLLPFLWFLPLLLVAFVAAAWVARLSPGASLPLFASLVLVLPWIPGRVPGAFLLWSGHAAAGVWIGVVVAMLSARCGKRERESFPGSMPRKRLPLSLSDPRRAPRLAALIACVLYIASAWGLAAVLPSGDEPHYLIITQSLLKDRDLQIENNHARGDYSE